MDPPEKGYEHWKHHYKDCELVHVMWTDYCGILHEKYVSAKSFGMMYSNHEHGSPDSTDLIPLTVSAAALTSLPNGEPAAEDIHPSCETYKLVPDYDSLQPCIDSSHRATVFAKVEAPNGVLIDAREILKKVPGTTNSGEVLPTKASFEFQFVLRRLSNGKMDLPQTDGPVQHILQKLARGLRARGKSATGLDIRSSHVSADGVVTIALAMSDNVLEAVDNYYRFKRALQSVASTEGLRASFFYPSEDVPGSAFSGTRFDVMCRNVLRCRLHLATDSGRAACFFAANAMSVRSQGGEARNPSIYAVSKPNWLTYGQREQYRGDPSPKREWMTWGIRNSKTTINFPEGLGCESGRLEFGDIDCMANMYLVVAELVALGMWSKLSDPLKHIPRATNDDEYDPNTSLVFPENPRVPLTGLNACQSLPPSVRRKKRQWESPLGVIMRAYLAVRAMEDESIVKAVEVGRATSARELLGKWY